MNRIDLVDGELDEVVTEGGHLEQMDYDCWFLELYRADGSSVAVRLESKKRITAHFEERPPARKTPA